MKAFSFRQSHMVPTRQWMTCKMKILTSLMSSKIFDSTIQNDIISVSVPNCTWLCEFDVWMIIGLCSDKGSSLLILQITSPPSQPGTLASYRCKIHEMGHSWNGKDDTSVLPSKQHLLMLWRNGRSVIQAVNSILPLIRGHCRINNSDNCIV